MRTRGMQAVAILLVAVAALAQENVISSYPNVVNRISAPPIESLSIVCQKKVDDTFVSLLAFDEVGR